MRKTDYTPAGQRNKQIILQAKTVSKDLELNTTETWIDWRTVWGAVLPETGSTFYKLKSESPEVTIVFIVKYNSNIRPYMRIKYKSRYYAVLGIINPQEANVELWLTCKGVA